MENNYYFITDNLFKIKWYSNNTNTHQKMVQIRIQKHQHVGN